MSGEKKVFMVECENLVKIYKTKTTEVLALQGLDFTAEYGKLLAVIGNSGSGKSTLLNVLGGLDRPSAGKLIVDGKNLLKLNDNEMARYKRETVGFIWQNNSRNLIPYLTALQNVEAPLILSGSRKRRARAKELLDADMFFMDSELFCHAAKAGVLADIGDLLPEYAPGLFGKYDPQRLDITKYQGRLLYLPNLMEDSLRYYFIIREDLLRAVGMNTVETFEDYERFLAKIREAMPDITPGAVTTEVRTNSAYTTVYAFCIPVNLFTRPYAENRGYVFVDEYLDLVYGKDDPGRLIFRENTQEASEAEEMLKRWEESRYIKTREAETYEAQLQLNDNTTELILGKLASCVGTWQQAVRINDILMENKMSHLYVKAFPLYPQNTAVKSSPASYSMGFNTHSPNIGKCLELLGWIQQNQAHYDLFMYGVKGEDYNLIGDQLDIPVAMIPELVDTAFDWRKAMANWEYLRTNTSVPPSWKKDFLQSAGLRTEYAVYEGWMPDFSSLNLPLSLPGVSGSCPIYDRERWFIDTAVLGRDDMKTLFSENSLDHFQKQWTEWRKE